jgi:hypothetical protein
MVLNTSHSDQKVELEINTAVGSPYSLLDRIIKGGIGSPKLNIILASEELSRLLYVNQDRPQCSIELRPKGIIVHLKSRLDTYALPIPYYKLTLYKGDKDVFTVFKDQHKIKVEAKGSSVKAFFKRILKEKTEHSYLP